MRTKDYEGGNTAKTRLWFVENFHSIVFFSVDLSDEHDAAEATCSKGFQSGESIETDGALNQIFINTLIIGEHYDI